ncbi:MAG TPA: hypothetical protein PKN64_09890 [Casimicrobium sp.]|nr:hypothetical protein [Casimicrobium sp.]
MSAIFRLVEANCHVDDEEFSLVVTDVVTGEVLTTPRAPASAGFPLALSLLLASKADENARITIPLLGGITLLSPADAGAILLSYYPGPLATANAAEMFALLGL